MYRRVKWRDGSRTNAGLRTQAHDCAPYAQSCVCTHGCACALFSQKTHVLAPISFTLLELFNWNLNAMMPHICLHHCVKNTGVYLLHKSRT